MVYLFISGGISTVRLPPPISGPHRSTVPSVHNQFSIKAVSHRWRERFPTARESGLPPLERAVSHRFFFCVSCFLSAVSHRFRVVSHRFFLCLSCFLSADTRRLRERYRIVFVCVACVCLFLFFVLSLLSFISAFRPLHTHAHLPNGVA